MNYKDNNYWRALYDLFRTVGVTNYNNGLTKEINFLGYPEGYCIYGIQLQENHSGGELFSPLQEGQLTISLRFNSPVPESLVGLCFFEYENYFTMTKTGEIALDLA